MTLVGALAAAALLAAGKRPARHGGSLYFTAGSGWGGVSLGLFFIVQKDPPERLKDHEFGHSVQNAFFGPFMPFIVSLPSLARYWLRRVRAAAGLSNPPYDSVWFEGRATELGQKALSLWS